MTANLSPAAKSALINVGTSRQGALIGGTVKLSVIQELVNAGMIGPQRGLTRAGSIARDRAVNEALNAF